jgi:hypothetical protein
MKPISESEKLQGADVLITIFCDFLPIFYEKFKFFLKTNVMMQILQKFAVHSLNKQRHFFAKILAKTFSKP